MPEKGPAYDFKPKAEAVWFILTAMAAAALQFLNGAPPTDWHAWGIALAAAAVRAGLGAALHALDGVQPGPRV